MQIKKEKVEQIISKLNEMSKSNGGIVCPVCGNKKWTIGDKLFEAREFQNGDIIFGGESNILPFFALTCSRCGFTLMMNALKYDIVDQNDDKNNHIEKQSVENGK